MRRLFVLAILAAPAHADDLKSVVEKHAQTLVKDRPHAAIVVGVIAKGEEQVFAFGKCDGKAPDPDSVFEIGSVTKVFTGILLADRVKAGVVKLDDPVQKHLPDGWSLPRRDDRDITLLQLATHTSGLPRTPRGFPIAAMRDPKNPFGQFDRALMVKELPKTELKDPAGSRQVYSNLGIGLLGHALANASKSPSFEALLRQRVLDPLGLADTSILLTPSQKKRLVPGYDESGKPQPNWDFPCLEACGALRSTLTDQLKFVRANLDPAGPLKEALLMAHQSWRVVVPAVEQSGLCWVRYVAQKAPVRIWHNGETGGYHSFCGFVPDKGGVVVLFNVATYKVDDLGFAVLKHLATEAK
jgi:CubicO group peptidase (beta-lactamase class C family)